MHSDVVNIHVASLSVSEALSYIARIIALGHSKFPSAHAYTTALVGWQSGRDATNVNRL